MSSQAITYRFCPRCATPMRPFDEAHPYRRRCPACDWIYWGSAKPTVTALVQREGTGGQELLLVRRTIEPRRGMWTLPGGFVDLYETPEEAVRRELLEETALEVELLGIHGIWTDRYAYGGEDQRTLNIVYLASVAPDAVPRAGDDAEDATWFDAASLPTVQEMAFDSCAAAVALWRSRLQEEHD